MSDMLYFKVAGEHERGGRIDKAFHILVQAKRDSRRVGIREVIDQGLHRLSNKAARMTSRYLDEAEPIFEHEKNPRNLSSVEIDPETSLQRPIVSLTSISGRLDRVKQTILSLRGQSLRPHSINLYVSAEPYLLDEGISPCAPELVELYRLGVNVYKVRNIGPYRKQYPVVWQLFGCNAPLDTIIVTVDDDVIYPGHILEKLVREATMHDAVVAHRGREIVVSENGLAPYGAFPAPKKISSYLNMGTGKNGIAYKLAHFPRRRQEYIGPILAPTADDLWCKWAISAKCVATVILEPNAAYDSSLDFPETAPTDKNGLFHKFNAKGTNDVAITNLEGYYSMHGRGIVDLYKGAQ